MTAERGSGDAGRGPRGRRPAVGDENMDGKDIGVLDRGAVRLVSFMGGDARVGESARICTMADGTEESDARLARHLIRMGHGTPFEHSVFTFYVKCPIFVARQWFRHRIGSYNEMSMRYCLADREYYVPKELMQEGREAERERYVSSIEGAFDTYEAMEAAGLRREAARGVLPVAAYTQFYWTVNARSLMNFLDLRLDTAAQWEIRQYAKAILGIVESVMPSTAEAFKAMRRGEMEPPRREYEFG